MFVSSTKAVCLCSSLAMQHFPVCLEVGPPRIPENEVNANSKASECFTKCPIRIACNDFNYSRYIYRRHVLVFLILPIKVLMVIYLIFKRLSLHCTNHQHSFVFLCGSFSSVEKSVLRISTLTSDCSLLSRIIKRKLL